MSREAPLASLSFSQTRSLLPPICVAGSFLLGWVAVAGEVTETNIETMGRAACYAGSAAKDEKAIGGFGKSDNLPSPAEERQGTTGQISLVAKPDRALRTPNCDGMTLLVVNRTREDRWFVAEDSRLAITQEAVDHDGLWRPVEYLPSSWCGNSYHRVLLPPDQQWQFCVPKYKGEYWTTMRFKLQLEEGALYSNEFLGSVNPSQFTNKGDHPHPEFYND